MTSVDSNFNFLCGRPHGARPPPPVHMREPDPLHVDVINGWPLTIVLDVHWQSLDCEEILFLRITCSGQCIAPSTKRPFLKSSAHSMSSFSLKLICLY